MRFAFPSALHNRFAPRLANITCAVESVATFASCRTVALATAVHLSSLIKVYTMCNAPTTCSKMVARHCRSPCKRCNSALSLPEFEGAISRAPLLACRPLSLVDYRAICFVMWPPAGRVASRYFPIRSANGHSSMSSSSSGIATAIALCPLGSAPEGSAVFSAWSWALSSSRSPTR